MTEDRRFKRAIRARMAETGERYTEARRALLAHDRETEATPTEAPGVPLGWFTDQAYNAILLAVDEARMLGQPRVEPEHLLLAVARIGNVQVLLARDGITAGAIHAAVARMGGFGAELVLGPVPRSPAGEGVLRRAVAAAADRGIRDPSTQHLLLGLAEHGGAAAVLRELGVVDVIALVDMAYPPARPAIGPETLERRARELAARDRTPPSPGPIAPVFERFTAEARRAVEAAIERAGSHEDPYVMPAHILLGLLGVEEGVVASVRARHEWQFEAAAARATEIMADRASRATGIFSVPARRLVAEEVLKIADRLGHRSLGTGHLLLAIVENRDEDTAEILDALPDAQQIVAEVTLALPGEEHT
jgi:ATP-dependent Clp protease ATP-binding subunit ClpA